MMSDKKSGQLPACHLVVMVKTPVAGRVKTRLSRDIGTVPATYFYRTMVQNIIRRVSRDTRWQTWLAIAPDKDLYHPFWPQHINCLQQGNGDLGARMQHVMDVLPPGRVVIIGTDIPEITPSHISCAFERLGTHDAVFGPCDDGGYWLVGQKRSPRILDMFGNVRWSSSTTLTDTLDNLCKNSVAQIMTLRDIDNGPEYASLKYYGSRRIIS